MIGDESGIYCELKDCSICKRQMKVYQFRADTCFSYVNIFKKENEGGYFYFQRICPDCRDRIMETINKIKEEKING